MSLSEKRQHTSMIDQTAFHSPLVVGSGPVLYYNFYIPSNPPTILPSSLLQASSIHLQSLSSSRLSAPVFVLCRARIVIPFSFL